MEIKGRKENEGMEQNEEKEKGGTKHGHDCISTAM